MAGGGRYRERYRIRHTAWHDRTVATAILRLLLLVAALAMQPPPATAATVRYDLDGNASRVGFVVRFGPDSITGVLPVLGAKLALDADTPRNSRVHVVLDTTRARASFPFATRELRGPRVLHSARHPTLEFATTELRADGRMARVHGLLTIRGITRPITLQAQIYRPAGTAPGDLSLLTVHLWGVVRRSEFGADGWAGMVGDEVHLDIRVTMRRVE
ncbi:YceI family protein [Tropicimonas marinistellae]|uniref:YceI family protein n=1 Tax=Tropicimonas marinistellae TaxID=1739787 RepID=UPI000830ED2F|nr:YceI family protein [Tropicimonas marinistellae]